MKLVVPELESDAVLQLLNYLPETIPDKEFELDFSHMAHFDPLAMLLFGSVLRRYRLSHGDSAFKISGHLDKSYAGTMGFFKYISPRINYGKSPGEASGNYRYIPITCLKPYDLQGAAAAQGCFLEVGDAIEKETKRLAGIVSPNDRNLSGLISYLLRELVRNVPEHAHSDAVWVCGQYWPSKDLAEIAVLDEGIGIKASLSRNAVHQNYLKTDEDSLRWALKPGVSQNFSPSKKPATVDAWGNSGFGLYATSQITHHLGGRFYLVSGNSFLRQDGDEITTDSTLFEGTAIGVRLSTSLDFDWNGMLKSIICEGEKEAKGIRGAFKRASLPSRGLIY